MKGVLAFDLDGTLTLERTSISKKVVEALHQFHNQGWTIALVTGRVFAYAHHLLDFLPFDFLCAVQNGADLLEFPAKKLLHRSYLPSKFIAQIAKAYEGEEEDFVIYSGIDQGDFCYYRKERYSDHMLKYLKVLESLGGDKWQTSSFAFAQEDAFPLVKCFGKKKGMERVFQKLKSLEVEVSMIRDPVDRSLYLNLITHPSANKGAVIEKIRSLTKAPIVIAAGDDLNDLKMLKAADISIAIKSAPKELLDQADLIAPSGGEGLLETLKEVIDAHR